MDGPTPDTRVSWCDVFAEAFFSTFDNKTIGNRKIILVCPKPYERNC